MNEMNPYSTQPQLRDASGFHRGHNGMRSGMKVVRAGCPIQPALRFRASVLVALLWVVALLSVVVISVLHSTWMDLIMVKSYGDRIQAHYLALAGIERT